MFRTLIEKLRAWSHPDLREQHAKRRSANLNSLFNWKVRRVAKEGRKFTEIYRPENTKDNLDISIEKVFCRELEAKGFKTEIGVSPGSTCHYIKISWRD